MFIKYHNGKFVSRLLDFCHSRVVSSSDLLATFFAGYDKAVRPDFGKCDCATDFRTLLIKQTGSENIGYHQLRGRSSKCGASIPVCIYTLSWYHTRTFVVLCFQIKANLWLSQLICTWKPLETLKRLTWWVYRQPQQDCQKTTAIYYKNRWHTQTLSLTEGWNIKIVEKTRERQKII